MIDEDEDLAEHAKLLLESLDNMDHPGMWYDRDCNEITFAEWAVLRGKGAPYCRIAYHGIGQYEIFTTWLGINHQWNRRHRPLIFETMVFVDDGASDPGDWRYFQDRYSTVKVARMGHEAVVAAIRKGMTSDEFLGPLD